MEAELSLQVQMFFAKTHESFYYMKRFTFFILSLLFKNMFFLAVHQNEIRTLLFKNISVFKHISTKQFQFTNQMNYIKRGRFLHMYFE